MMDIPWLDVPWRRFTQRVNLDRMAHALLIDGPAGLGKGVLAERMAVWLLCLRPLETSACGQCRSCRLLDPNGAKAHPELHFLRCLEDKKEIIVDQIRELIDKLSLTTSISARKIALIEPAERLNKSAANALLKTLEEPPGETVLILVCNDASRLPITVRSRCQQIAVVKPSEDQALAWLKQAGNLSGAQAVLALRAAGGSPLNALEMVKNEQLERFTELQQLLAQLHNVPGGVSNASSRLADIESSQLWRWLSQSAAERLKSALNSSRPGRVDQGSGPPQARSSSLDLAGLAQLQARADRHRRLTESPVRQDLLLQEWLLEWSILNRGGQVRLPQD